MNETLKNSSNQFSSQEYSNAQSELKTFNLSQSGLVSLINSQAAAVVQVIGRSSITSIYENVRSSEHFDETEPSRENEINLWLCALQSFFMNMCFTVSLTAIRGYVHEIDPEYEEIGFLLSLNTISQGLFVFILSPWTNYQFRIPFNSLNFLCLFSFGLYVLAGTFKSILMIAISRTLLGIAAGKVVTRRYILTYAPQNQVKRFSLAFMIALCLGSGVGPILDYFVTRLPAIEVLGVKINSNNWGGVAAMTIFAGFAIIVSILFSDPYDPKFRRFKKAKISFSKNAALNSTDSSFESTAESSVSLIVSAIFVCIVLVRVLIEGNVVSSIRISAEFLESKDNQKLFTTAILCCGYWGVLPFAFIAETMLKSLKERQISLIGYILVLSGALIASDLVWDNMWNYSVGFVLLQSTAPLMEGYLSSLLKKKMPEQMQKGFFNAGFIVVIASQVGKAVGSNLSDLLQKIKESFEYSLNSLQTTENLVAVGVSLSILIGLYKRLNT